MSAQPGKHSDTSEHTSSEHRESPAASSSIENDEDRSPNEPAKADRILGREPRIADFLLRLRRLRTSEWQTLMTQLMKSERQAPARLHPDEDLHVPADSWISWLLLDVIADYPSVMTGWFPTVSDGSWLFQRAYIAVWLLALPKANDFIWPRAREHARTVADASVRYGGPTFGYERWDSRAWQIFNDEFSQAMENAMYRARWAAYGLAQAAAAVALLLYRTPWSDLEHDRCPVWTVFAPIISFGSLLDRLIEPNLARRMLLDATPEAFKTLDVAEGERLTRYDRYARQQELEGQRELAAIRDDELSHDEPDLGE